MSVQSVSQVNASSSNAFVRHVVARCLALVNELRTRRTLRQALGGVSDRELQDAGLIRSDIDAACDNPLSHSTRSALNAVARTRAGNW